MNPRLLEGHLTTMLDLKIAKPCDQSWTAMKGDDTVRHCERCDHHVYNIAEMTEAEVEELIRRTEGRFCARIYRRTDSRVMTADCPRGVATVRRRKTLAVAAAFAATYVLVAPALRPATTGVVRTRTVPAKPRAVEPPEEPTMGKVAVPESALQGEVAVPNERMGLVVEWSKSGFFKEGNKPDLRRSEIRTIPKRC